MNLVRVNRQHPCPVCKKPDWCSFSEDGNVAICMRVESNRPTRNGGYLHRLGKQTRPTFVRRPPPPPPPSPPKDFAGMLADWQRKTHQDAIAALGKALGVSASALAEIGATTASQHAAWAFPMRDAAGKVVGIRLRADDGRKWAVKGSKDGLFFPLSSSPSDRVAVVCEGPTDTAAALSLGLWAIGRPSCMGATDHVKALCRRMHIQTLVIVADNDTPKPRPGGGFWQPGFDGARKLASAVGVPYKIIAPPAKDFRAWVQAGATRQQFDFLEQQTQTRTA